MKYGALFGWGIVIYAVMFLLWSAFVTYGFVSGAAPRLVGLLILIALALLAGRSLGFASWRDILPYSFTWGVMMSLIDAVMSAPVTGWAMYADWNIWFGYSLVVLAPLFAPYIPRFLGK